jgi:hypothetical protein
MTELHEWESFYVIVGSSAGALIGLQFVVMTLIAETPPLRVREAGAAFATPTIVHFSAVLLISALLSAPWQSTILLAALWAAIGLAGLTYTLIVGQRMKMQKSYRPEFEDWLFYVLLPLIGYGVLVASAIIAPSYIRAGLFGVGTAALMMLFIGIHNAWDAIAYIVFVKRRNADGDEG